MNISNIFKPGKQLIKVNVDKSASLQEQALEFFNNTLGLEGIKENLYLNLTSTSQINTLLAGPPGTGKTLLMKAILENCNDVVYFDGASGSSGAGFIQLLETHKNMRILIIDEIDKLKKNEMSLLLSLLNDGTVFKVLKTHTVKLKFEGIKVFATTNSTAKLTKPLKSRFETYCIPEYTDEDFINTSVHCLRNVLPEHIAAHIATILLENDMKDVRLVLSIAKKINPTKHNEQDVTRIINNKLQYSSQEDLDYN